jgi:N-acetylmuramoyl-L-alanine amidase
VPRSAERLERRVRVASSPRRWDRLRPRSELILFWLVGVIAFGFLPGHSDAGVTISDVRVWPAPEYTRITIESNQPIEYTVFTAKNPERLVLDLEGVTLDAGLEGLSARISTDDPYIAQARVARNRPGVVRVVLQLRGEVKPQAFSLQPVGSYAHRLVVDIYPAHPVDPILTLLQQIDKDKPGGPLPGAGAAAPPGDDPNVSGVTAAVRQPAGSSKEPRQTAPEPTKSAEKMLAGVAPKGKSKDGGMRPVTIAIDAGHGGEDPGAKGRNGTSEKDVTLAIARKLKALVDAESGMRAMLVRDGDYFVELKERVNKARKMRADLFVSIHADAYNKPHARGSSVFALSQRGATSVVAGWLAKKENEADLIGGVNLDVRDPYVKQVLLDLSQTATINDSIQLGRSVLAEIGGINTLHKARVEQAGFAVLKAPDIPSILVETAFISNPSEETRLCQPEYQEQLAAAMLQGIRKYFARNPPLTRDKIAVNP